MFKAEWPLLQHEEAIHHYLPSLESLVDQGFLGTPLLVKLCHKKIQFHQTDATNIIKKSYLPEKICLAIKNTDFNEKKKQDLNFLIQSKRKLLKFFLFLMIVQVITVKH